MSWRTTSTIRLPYRSELLSLLSESSEKADQRLRRTGAALGNLDGTLALYGAGRFGREMLARLRSCGIEPVLFLDDTPAKQGSVVDGLEVVAPTSALEVDGHRLVVAVTI